MVIWVKAKWWLTKKLTWHFRDHLFLLNMIKYYSGNSYPIKISSCIKDLSQVGRCNIGNLRDRTVGRALVMHVITPDFYLWYPMLPLGTAKIDAWVSSEHCLDVAKTKVANQPNKNDSNPSRLEFHFSAILLIGTCKHRSEKLECISIIAIYSMFCLFWQVKYFGVIIQDSPTDLCF